MSLRDIDWRKHPRAGGYTSLIEDAEKRHELPPGLLGALIHRESKFDADAVSPAGAIGIAQLMPVHTDVDAKNPEEAIDYAARYLSSLHDRFDSWDHALAAYNHGPTNVSRAVRRNADQWEAALPTETREYLAALSPERVTYPASADAQEDPLLVLARQADARRSDEAKDAQEVLAMMQGEADVARNLEQRGWLKDTGAAILRGPIKAAKSLFGMLSNPGSLIAPVTFNVEGGTPVERAFDVPLDYLGAPETVPGKIAEPISQFVSGFLVTRRVTGALPGFKGTSQSANIFKSLVDAGITSGVFFKGHEGNLANLIESFPGAKNSITDFLAVDEEDTELTARAKNALVDSVGGAAVEVILYGLRAMRAARKIKREQELEAPDSRPELDVDRVAAAPISRHDPLPARTEVAPEVSPSGTSATPKLVDEFDEATGETIVRTENGMGLATETETAIRIERMDVTEAARGKGEGLEILRRFAQRASERGLPLFSDVSISPAMARVYAKLKAAGFNVKQNAAEINPETGNLVSLDPRKSVFEVEPAPAKVADAPKLPDEATPQPAPAVTKAVEPKPDYGTAPLDVTEARLREEIGLTDDVVADVRAKLASGEVKPEEVADLIGINGARIDWTGVADEKAMAGMLNTVSRVIDDVVGGAARYSRVTVETVEKVVGKIGATADDALDLFNSLKAKGGIEARIMAARITLNASAAKLYRLGNLVADGQATPEDLLELAVHDRRHMLLQATVRGSKSMVARALRMMRESTAVNEQAFNLSKARHERAVRKAQEGVEAAKRKRTAKPKGEAGKVTPEDSAVEHATAVLDNAKKAGRKLSENDVADALSQMGYTAWQVRRLGKTIAKAKNVEDVHTIARTVSWGKALQGRLATLYINNILSGLPTLAINATSGWLKMAESIIERYGAAAIALARGGDKYDLIAAHRAAIATKAMWGNSWKLAAAAWKEGLPQVDLFGRVEVAIKGGTGQTLGQKIITAPSRAILTIDEYFKNVFYQQELHARAVEIAAAKARLFKGQAQKQVFDQEYAEVLRNPTDDVRLDAIENARYQTFQNALKSDFSNGLIRWTNGTPVLKFVVPFVRTPVNIVKQALDRSVLSPLQLVKREMREQIASGSRAGNTELFRMFAAVTAFGVIFDAALDGKITGSKVGGKKGKNSADFDQQAPYIANGVQYHRLDPWGTVFGLTADLATLYNEHRLRKDESEELSPELSEAFGNIIAILQVNLTDKTFFKGISDAVEAYSSADESKYRWQNYVNTLAANLVPFSSLQRNFARAHDEYAREAFSFSDKLMQQAPFLREQLPLRRDYLGRPIKETERLGPDWLSPIAIAKDDPDPTAKAFADLEMPYRMPDKVIGGVRLDAKQYSRLVEIRGQFVHERIAASLNSGEWERVPVFQRQEMVRAWAEAGGRKARAELVREDGDGEKSLGTRINRREAALDALREAAE